MWPVTFCEPLLQRPQSHVSSGFQYASLQEDEKGQDMEDFHNAYGFPEIPAYYGGKTF